MKHIGMGAANLTRTRAHSAVTMNLYIHKVSTEASKEGEWTPLCDQETIDYCAWARVHEGLPRDPEEEKAWNL